jgi:hypothetical protein
MLVIGNYLNIFILLAIVLLTIYLIEKIPTEKRERSAVSIRMMQGAILAYGGFASFFTGYSITGFIFLMTLYLAFKSSKYKMLPLIGMIMLNYGKWFYTIGVYASIGMIYIVQYIPHEMKRTNKWFFYAFYPLHLLCFYLLLNFFL